MSLKQTTLGTVIWTRALNSTPTVRTGDPNWFETETPTPRAAHRQVLSVIV